ncbi:MAG: hypothetical protein ACOJUL_02190 [Candidatus Pollutiaquabacter aromativorans]|jgi:surface polysaccharide O-acyltransferase-like enzyme
MVTHHQAISPLYEEKQYLGYNSLSLLRRLMLTLFCFGVYWWKKMNNQNSDLFFWLGVGIIVVSILLLFVLHLKIKVYKTHIELDGLWTARTVRIPLADIVKIERLKYSRYHLNNPVFNLHLKNTIRFYTGGNDAVEITDKSGTPYRIGSQHAGALETAVRKAMSGI